MGRALSGEWILIDDRHVQRVGSGDPPNADRVVDLPGATILPGFVDSHVHLTSTGLSLENDAVETARSAGELLALARERASTTTESVLALQGFDETRWEDPAFPSLAELDAAVDRPLVIRRIDGHMALANSPAMTLAAVLDVDGCERDAEGHPTGRVVRSANAQLGRWIAATRSEHRIEELQLAAASFGAAHGITALHEMAMPHEEGFRDVEVLLRHRQKLPLDVATIVATTDVARVIDMGLASIGGDLAVDGSIGARTAALSEPYADAGGNGVTYLADDELAEFFHGGHSAGLQVGVHALGDRGIEQVLASWERVYRSLDSRERRHFRARRHRVEHMEMASGAQIERAAVLGLAASVQPAFDAAWGRPGGLYELALGIERAAAMNPFRTMLERGLVLGTGSDAPVTPLDPWRAVAAMEDHHSPSQRLPRDLAVRLATEGSAHLVHQEEKKGTLQPGSHADFAAYEVDPFEVADVRGLRPFLTVSLGREVFAV
jgi:predicted amidohydrolase YtcJ